VVRSRESERLAALLIAALSMRTEVMNVPIEYEERTLLVAFADLANYVKLTESWTNGETFTTIAEFAEIVGNLVGDAGGKVIKIIGDAALITFEDSEVVDGVEVLRSLKVEIDRWLKSRGFGSELLIRAHVGRVAVGKIGPRNDKRLDVIGRVVNETAKLKRGPFVTTSQLDEILNS
jgi:class 3 adenylate cyclase